AIMFVFLSQEIRDPNSRSRISPFRYRISDWAFFAPKAETLPGTHWRCRPPGNGEAALSVSSRYLPPGPRRRVRGRRSGGLLRPLRVGTTSSCPADLIPEGPRNPHRCPPCTADRPAPSAPPPP